MANETAPARPSVGVVGPALAAVGGLLLAVSFLALDWLDVTTIISGADGDDGVRTTTLTLREIADHREDAAASSVVANDYLTWLSWTLLVAAVLLAGAAAVRRPAALRWRIAGAVAGVASAVLTWTATTHFFQGHADASFPAHDGFGGAGIGAHLAFAGFLLVAVGAAVGPLGPGRAVTAGRTSGTVPRTAVPRTALVGGTVGGVGGVLALVALAVLPWYDTTGRDLPEHFGFGDFGTYAADDPSGLVRAWFPTLAWVVLAVAVAGVVVAAASVPFAALGRVLAVVAGVGGAGLVVLVLQQLLGRENAPFDGLFDGMLAGVPVLVVGLLLCAVGGVLAARRHVHGAGGLGSPGDEDAVGAAASEVGQRP